MLLQLAIMCGIKNKHMNLRVGFVGVSHLGLNYLAAAAEKNFSTIGFDINSELISKLKHKQTILIVTHEPELFKNVKTDCYELKNGQQPRVLKSAIDFGPTVQGVKKMH